jgi:hypothetical protein
VRELGEMVLGLRGLGKRRISYVHSFPVESSRLGDWWHLGNAGYALSNRYDYPCQNGHTHTKTAAILEAKKKINNVS